MQQKSQNGWPAVPNTSTLVRGSAAGFGFWAANDDVRVIFEHWIKRFNDRIERIAGKVLDDWSYANRMVRGSTKTISNHGSGTAIDINALAHGRGAKNTFSDEEQDMIHSDLKFYEGVLAWGGDFNTVTDDMHFEIRGNAAAVKRIADKIRALEEDDVKLTDQVPYTPLAKKRMEADSEDFGTVIQWPPAVRMARDEIALARAEIAELKKTVDKLVSLLTPKTTNKSG
jgi:hypothetical protein